MIISGGIWISDEDDEADDYRTDELLPPAGDEPDVWHNGGWVCRACGEPTETVPCELHQPTAWAEQFE